MKWILILAWASNGTGYTAQEFDSLYACQVAKIWAENNNFRGSERSMRTVCVNKATGEMK